MTHSINSGGTWTRWALTGVIVAVVAMAGALGHSRAQDATQNVRLDSVEKVLERMDAKLDRLLELRP